MIETDLRAYLMAHPEVGPLVGNRIYPLALPQSPALPAVTYQRISTTRTRTKDGPTGAAEVRVQMSCWSMSYIEAKRVADAIRHALDGYRGSMGGHYVYVAASEGELDFYEPDTQLYQVAADYLIWYEEV